MTLLHTKIVKYILLNIYCTFEGCIIGMYGINCENNCSLYCAYGDCDKTTGTCLDGCKSGFIGRFCNKSNAYIIKQV